MYSSLLFILTCMMTICQLANGLFGDSEVIINTMTQCKHQPDTPFQFVDMVVTRSSDATEYNITGNVKVINDIDGPIKLKLVVRKCSDGSYMSCDTFIEYAVEDFCHAEDNNLVIQYTKFLGIKQGCPIVKDSYPIQEITIKINKMIKNAFAVGKYWLGTLEGYHNEEMVLCEWMEGLVRKVQKSRYG